MRYPSAIDRLLAQVSPEPNTGCHLWVGKSHTRGYPVLGVGKSRTALGHRIAYEHFKGPIPEGAHVLHTCDVPSCVNPDHLWLGDPRANSDDKIRKGRLRYGLPEHRNRGENQGRSKLTWEQVDHIRRREMSQRKYAALYGVVQQTISSIQTGRIWCHARAQ